MADNAVDQYLDAHFDIESLFANYQFGYLQRIIEACFCLDSSAVSILSKLFARFGYEFQVPKNDDFVTKLLFTIYAQEFPLSCLASPKTLQHYLFQLQAGCVSKARLKTLWNNLLPVEQQHQLAFSAINFDEGAFAIFAAAKKLPFDSVATAQEKKRLVELLQPYSKSPLHSVDKFVDVFGLYGHQMPVSLHEFESGSLIQKLEAIQGCENAAEFAEQILLHIDALSSHPEWYSQGFDLLVHALPTSGKDLSKLYWLESTCRGIKKIGRYIDVSKHSIYVLDQSEQKLFLKNAAYIGKLKKCYGVDIIHLDTEAILKLASEYAFEHLIKGFGYGGARNAVFLLAANLHKGSFVHMGDDDVYVHPSLVFSDALWAYRHKDEYCSLMGYVMGRFARDASFTKHDVLHNTPRILAHCPWIASAYPHGMSCLVSKPKLCLNLPFGQEENHMLAMKRAFFTFRIPTIHLAGPRYPKPKGIPKTIFCGLAAFLKSRYVDIVQRLLVTELLDPTNRYNQCTLPWNLKKAPFTSFEEMMAYMQDPATKADMQKRFWSNFERAVIAFSTKGNGEHMHSSEALQEIIDTNWDQEFLTVMPPREAKALQAFYKEFAKEASHYKAFMFALHQELQKKSSSSHALDAAKTSISDIENKPLAYSLYLFCNSIQIGSYSMTV